MAKQQTDEELNLKRKARRRLVGAVALTLVVVVVLPMVLDSEPKSTVQNIELRIPSPDRVGGFVPGVATSEVVEASPSDVPMPTPGSAPAAASAIPAVAQADTAKPIAVPAASVPGKTSGILGQNKAETSGKAQATANKPPELKVTEPKSSEPKIAESRVADKAAGTAAEGYVAQVGAYSNAATAKQELDKLKAWGFKAYTEKAGDKVRVRVGPYTEREKAEKVRQLLEKHGLHPVIMSNQ